MQGHALFAHDKAKRGLLYGKLGELNRPSFKALLQEFAAVEGVNLAGLWPVVDPTPQGLNLYQIRNHIVHGRLLPHAAADALIAARDYLRWTLERCILAVLQWDLEKSRVSPIYLSRATYNWGTESQLLKKILEANGRLPSNPASPGVPP